MKQITNSFGRWEPDFNVRWTSKKVIILMSRSQSHDLKWHLVIVPDLTLCFSVNMHLSKKLRTHWYRILA